MIDIEESDVLDRIETYAESDTPEAHRAVAIYAMRIGLEAMGVMQGTMDKQALEQVAERVLWNTEAKIRELVGEQNKNIEAALAEQRTTFDTVVETQSEEIGGLLTAHQTAVEAQREEIGALLTEHRDKLLDEFKLDVDGSAMERLNKRITEAFGEVRDKVAGLAQYKQDRKQSTQGGHDFERDLGRLLEQIADGAGDHFSSDGGSPGVSGRGKKGDYTVTFGEGSRFPGEAIAIEAKRSYSYKLDEAWEDCRLSRENRRASVAIFVWNLQAAKSQKHHIPLLRRENDIIVLWDEEDPSTNIYLKTAYWLAKSIVMPAGAADDPTRQTEVDLIQKAFEQIGAQLNDLSMIKKKAETILGDASEMSKLASRVHARVKTQVEGVSDSIERLK